MLKLDASVAVYVHTGILDMRVGFDRLTQRVHEEVNARVIEGGYFVFFSRKRCRVRVLYWDGDGYAMWTKRLEVGSFSVEKKDGYEVLTAIDLEALLCGMSLSRVRMRKSVEKGLFCTR